MPAGWMHAVIDLIAYDGPYLELHQWKDEPWRRLGRRHRAERHEWYNAGVAGVWTLDDPMPAWVTDTILAIGDAHGADAAERYMVDLTHDHWDLLWDETPADRRRLIEGFFAWVLLRPDLLETRFSIDVIHGRIERQINGVLRWEPHPAVVAQYRRLRRYVHRVIERDPTLQEIVTAYETNEKASP